MRHNRNIHIALATAEPEVANRLLRSMQRELPSFSVKASILLIGSSKSSQFYKFCVPVDIIDLVTFYPPIVDSRNICQQHLQRKMNQETGIGLILDDDLIWTVPEHKFIQLLDKLIAKGCDMAFSSLSGDSPIPKEYTRTSPLLDVLMAISDFDPSDKTLAIRRYIGSIETSDHDFVECNAHHDFYSFNQSNFCRFDVSISTMQWREFIDNLVKGKTTTRRVELLSTITPANGRERGGATLIFNADVLSFRNDAIRSNRLISRRSDMIMGTDAAQGDFRLFNTPPMLEHRRDEVFDTHDSKKLIGDILGYSLVESREGDSFCITKFDKTLGQRIEQTIILMQESSNMLQLLKDWLISCNNIGVYEADKINSMINENKFSISAINSLDVLAVQSAFNNFNSKRHGK